MREPTLCVARTILTTPIRYVLLVQSARHDGKGWEFPGGKAKCSDPDLQATAKRELHEETAIQAAELEEISICDVEDPHNQVIRYGFFGKKVDFQIKPDFDGEEILSAGWFHLRKMPILTERTQFMLANGSVQNWLESI